MNKQKTTLPVKAKGRTPAGQMSSADVLKAFSEVLQARKEYAITREEEATKRQKIASDLRGRLQELADRREIVVFALEREFGFREHNVNEILARLDKALEQDKDDIAVAALSAIEGIVKQSPIGSALQVLAKSFEKEDEVIDI